jgi:hypothetical protein
MHRSASPTRRVALVASLIAAVLVRVVPGASPAHALVAADTGSLITLTPPTQSIRITTEATITGTLSFTDGTAADGRTVHVGRTNPDATHEPPFDLVTDSSGGFTIHDTPTQTGTSTYDVTFDGESGHDPATTSADVDAEKATASLTLKSSKGTVDYGKPVKLTAHLNAFDPGQIVNVYGTPYGGSKHLIASGPVDGSGTLIVSFKPASRTTFTAKSVEGPSYLSDTSGGTTVKVRPRFIGKMLGGYATKNGYRLYRYTKTCPGSHKGCPVSAFALAPNHVGKPVTVTLQLRAPSGWIGAGTFRGKLSRKSTIAVLWYYRNTNVIGVRARVRATFGGDADHLKATSKYLYFIVTR